MSKTETVYISAKAYNEMYYPKDREISPSKSDYTHMDAYDGKRKQFRNYDKLCRAQCCRIEEGEETGEKKEKQDIVNDRVAHHVALNYNNYPGHFKMVKDKIQWVQGL
jgi:hypothetical protein